MRTNVGKARQWIPSLIFVGVDLPRVHHQVDAFVGSSRSGLIAQSRSANVDVSLVVMTQTWERGGGKFSTYYWPYYSYQFNQAC